MKVIRALLTAALLTVFALTTVVADDEHEKLDGTAACQACEDNAAILKAECEAVYGEGDADCRHQSESYRVSCQNEWCH